MGTLAEGARGDLRQRTERYLEALARRGCRRTGPRRLIIETLLESQGEHLSAREIMERVQSKDPSVGFATVYRTLMVLSQVGLVHAVDRGEGFSRFHLAEGGTHLYVLCSRCGRIQHLDDQEAKVEALRDWAGKVGYRLMPQTIQILGICPQCGDDTPPEGIDHRYVSCCGRRRRRCAP